MLWDLLLTLAHLAFQLCATHLQQSAHCQGVNTRSETHTVIFIHASFIAQKFC